CPCPVRIEGDLSCPAATLYRERLVIQRPVIASISDSYELWVRPPALSKSSQAGQGFVDIHVVIQAAITRAYVGQADSHVLYLALDGEIKLVDLPIVGIYRVARNALRSNGSSAGGKRVRKGEQRLSILDRVEEAFGNLERAIRKVPGEAPQGFGEDPVAAAE